MENTLHLELHIPDGRADELYEMLRKLFNNCKGEESYIIQNIPKVVSEPIEQMFMAFEAGRIKTEMSCPMHNMNKAMQHGGLIGPILIPEGVDPMEFIRAHRQHAKIEKEIGVPVAHTKGEA